MDSSISLANTLSQCFQTITIAVVHCSVGRNFCSTCRKQLLLQEAEPPRKASRRLPGKTRPVVATFGRDDFPQASGRPGPILLRRAQRPDNSSPRPPLQRNFVEAVQSIGSQRVSRFGCPMRGMCAMWARTPTRAVCAGKWKSGGMQHMTV